MSDRYVKITDCDIGNDSRTGLAFACTIEGKLYWVPYSVCQKRAVNSKTKDVDVIEVESWWAERNELEGESCG